MRYVTQKYMRSHAIHSQVLSNHVIDTKWFIEDSGQSYLRVPLCMRFALYTGTSAGFPQTALGSLVANIKNMFLPVPGCVSGNPLGILRFRSCLPSGCYVLLRPSSFQSAGLRSTTCAVSAFAEQDAFPAPRERRAGCGGTPTSGAMSTNLVEYF